LSPGSRHSRIGIVGAGPAGLIAAIAAHRLGFDVAVFEQAPDFQAVGGGIGIQANGMQVLDALGLLAPFRPSIRLCSRARLYAPPDAVLTDVDLSGLAIPHAGFGVVLRYELQSHLLASARREGVRVELGARCAGLDLSPSPTLRFDNGATHACDLVIGCDGIRSRVRESAGIGGRSREIGEAYLRCVAQRRLDDELAIGESWANDGRRLGMFPLVGDRTYLFCSVPLGGWEEIRARRLAEWIESWRDFGAEALATLRAVPDWSRVNYDELKEITLHRWSRPPVFLAGDAAHAMTPNLGQGANSAMVDALVLVRLLAEVLAAGGTLEEVASRYERLRRRFVTRIQRAARQGGAMAAWTSAPARRLRRALFRTAMAIPSARRRALRMTAGYHPAEQRYLGRMPAGKRCQRPGRDANDLGTGLPVR
jgi:2-polyprenyl-6-methoxyphenol hydroxylase-like FAD-dependent oxidoreductase